MEGCSAVVNEIISTVLQPSMHKLPLNLVPREFGPAGGGEYF